MKKGIIAVMMMLLIVLMPVQAQGPEDSTPPNISNVLLTHGPTTLFTWTTNEPANTKIEFGTTTAMNQTETKPEYETAHSTILQTKEGTTYYYRITSCDQGNNCRSTTMDNFIAGPFYVRAEIPRYVRSTIIDIPGTTRPGAEVTVLVNNVEVRKAVIDDGTFLFRNIEVRQNCTITLKSTLGTETAQASYQTEVDNQPPMINATLPAVVTANSATAKVKVSEPVSLVITYNNLTKNVNATGTTDIKIENLIEGENIITFTAKDKAGYTSIAEERILYDKGPPEFKTHNLKELTPSYRQNVHAKGTLSEPGSITVFVNGKPQKTEPTNPDGTFSIELKLERMPENYSTPQRTALDSGVAWKSKVRLEAVDAAGQKKSTEEVEIAYTLCGQGTWIDVTLTDPLPDRLNPRLLIEGIQQIGIAFNYTYRGGYKATIVPRNVRIKSLQLAPEFQDEYDNGLVQVNSPTKPQKGKKPSGLGYIQVNFNPITDPWALEGETAPDNATMYDKEKKISEHRKEHCTVPDMGCMKLFLELEIPFSEEIPEAGYLPQTTQGITTHVENRIQKTCVNIQVMIDKRVPPDMLPEGFLKSTSKALGKIVENIDKVLKPVQTVGQYVMYTCVASQYLALVPLFLEKYNCQYKTVVSAVGGKGAFKEEIAEIGACEAQYKDQEESQSNCITCQKAIERRKWYDRTYRQICDRVMCPAAPSLQYYLKTKGQQKPVEIPAKSLTPEAITKLEPYSKDAGKISAGSDCAAWVQKRAQDELAKLTAEEKTKKPRTPPKLFFPSDKIQEIYQSWIKHKGDSGDEKPITCSGNHPATPACCGKEYMDEWSSACGVSALGSGLDTFNEIEESACLSAQATGKNEFTPQGGALVKCNNLLNSLGGFCTKAGGPPLTTIKVSPVSPEEAENLGMSKYGEDNYLYIVVQEQMAGGGISLIQIGQSKGHTVKLGMVVRTLEFEKSGDKIQAERSKINEKLEIKEHPGNYGFQQEFFTQDQIDAYRQKQEVPAEFHKRLCNAAGYGETTCSQVNPTSLYQQTIDAIGNPEKEYIIRPNDGLLNSIRCICFPTFIAYLKLWRNILNAVKNCIDVILITGDGEAGVCEAVISQYGCDLIYEVLTCFTQSFSTGGARTGIAGAGDLLGALTAAGSEMSRTSEGRYGDSAAYKTVFVEKKLVNSICMWAFYGTWNFDVATAFDQAVEEIPIESQSLIEPANRRFIAFNPATKPTGLTTWVYHFGIGFAAGADADLEIHLKCSGGFKCREADGFERGKCDCETEKDITISPPDFPTHVKKNEILSQEVFYTMQGSGMGNIRYDKVYLLYRFKEGSTTREEGRDDEKTITQSGGAGALPAFCRYDPASLSFRCAFGESSSGIRLSGGTPTYTHPKIQTFAVGDQLNISINITQDYPGGEKNNKYLEYAIYNGAGEMIKNNTDQGLAPLTTNGDYTKTIKDIPKIDPTWFGAAGPTGAAGATGPAAPINVVYMQWWSMLKTTRSPTNTLIESTTLKRGDMEIREGRNKYILEIFKEAPQKLIYQLYPASEPNLKPEGGFLKAEDTKYDGLGCGGILTGDIITCNTIADQTLTIKLKPDVRTRLNAPEVKNGERYQSYIDYNVPLEAISLCSPARKTELARFKIVFTAYDSDEFGQPTDQVSIDPITGDEATVEIPFSVVCAQTNDPDLKAKEIGAPTLAQLPNKIKQEIEKMLEAEGKKLTIAKNDANPSIPKTAISVASNLQSLIDEENINANTLLPIIETLKVAPEPYNTTILMKVQNLIKMLGPTASGIQTIGGIAGTAINNIQTLTDNTQISAQANTVINLLEQCIGIKKAILEQIRTMTTIVSCPDKKTDPEGNYYVCAKATDKPKGFDDQLVTLPCTSVEQKCWKLPKENNCEQQKDYGFTCEAICTTGSTQVTGWTKDGKQIPLVCPKTETPQCCRITVTALEKLFGLRDNLRAYLAQEETYITELQAKKFIGEDEEALKQLRNGELINYFETIKTYENEAAAYIKKTIDAYTEQEIEVPKEVNYTLAGISEFQGDSFVWIGGILEVVGYINTVNNKIQEMSKAVPKAEDIREQIFIIQNKLSESNLLKTRAINALNQKLTIGCPIGYQDGYVRGCFKDGCPADDMWKSVSPVCAKTEEKCCQAELSTKPPRIYLDNKQIGDKIFFEPKEYQVLIKIPLLEKNDMKEWAVLIDNINPQVILEFFDKNVYTRETRFKIENNTAISAIFDVPSPQPNVTVVGYANVECEAFAGEEKSAFSCEKSASCSRGQKVERTCAVQEICCKSSKFLIPMPAYLKFYPTDCGSGFVTIGSFVDNNDDWAKTYDGTLLKNNQELQLCVSKELENIVYFVSSPYDSDPCGENTHKGWIRNMNIQNWAFIAKPSSGYAYLNQYLHLCVNETELGEFVYFGVKESLDNNGQWREQACKSGEYSFKGHFAFLWTGETEKGWWFASAYSTIDRKMKLLTNLQTIEQYDWVGLCVKPVTIIR